MWPEERTTKQYIRVWLMLSTSGDLVRRRKLPIGSTRTAAPGWTEVRDPREPGMEMNSVAAVATHIAELEETYTHMRTQFSLDTTTNQIGYEPLAERLHIIQSGSIRLHDGQRPEGCEAATSHSRHTVSNCRAGRSGARTLTYSRVV